jgi:hypothetical protein
MGAAAMTREEVSGYFFYYFSNASDRAIDNGSFGWARPTNVGVRTIRRLTHTIIICFIMFIKSKLSVKTT